MNRDYVVSAQLCFATADVYGAIAMFEREHRKLGRDNLGWDSDGSRDVGESMERIAVELQKLASAVTS